MLSCLIDPAIVHIYLILRVGWDSSVSIATRYWLDGLGIEFGEVEIFCTRPDRPWGPPSLLYKGYWVSFPGVKRRARGVNYYSQLEPRLKK
jgi:hypothetical protein